MADQVRPTVDELGAMTLEEWKAYLTAEWVRGRSAAAESEVSDRSEESPVEV